MKRIIPFILLTVMGCYFVSCNGPAKEQAKQEQPAEAVYKFVQVLPDGSEQVEDLTAKNDTDALNLYFDRMEKILMDNIGKKEQPFKAMYIISPKGDTLNTDEKLMESVMKKTAQTMMISKDVPAGEAK